MKLYQHTFKAMGSQCSIQLYCETPEQYHAASSASLAELERLEAKYSRYRPQSLLSKINEQAGIQAVEIDAETTQLFQYAHVAYAESDGLFDITSGVLRNIWDFNTGRIPSQQAIEETLDLIGYDRIERSANHVFLPTKNMQIDFGGIVKEYAADCLSAIVKKMGINSGLINLAGDIHIVGPLPDGSPWQVGISHPAQPDKSIADIPMLSGGLASSGDYQRCFDIDGVRYCHILNPETGWPVQGLAAVSVWAEQCVVAGTLATIAMLKGEQAGIEWLASTGVPYLAIDQRFEVHIQSD
ncbi:MAG: FAD:protein FMN transferase [Aestuariibacter sp.]